MDRFAWCVHPAQGACMSLTLLFFGRAARQQVGRRILCGD